MYLLAQEQAINWTYNDNDSLFYQVGMAVTSDAAIHYPRDGDNHSRVFVPYDFRRKLLYSSLRFIIPRTVRPGELYLSPLPPTTNSPPGVPLSFRISLCMRRTRLPNESSVIPRVGQELHRVLIILDTVFLQLHSSGW